MPKHRVLIVEDEQDIAGLIKHTVERGGDTQADIVASGDAALRAVESRPPDLVILDLNLPNVSGIEVCRILKSRADSRHVPIIMVTARTTEDDRVGGLDLGADDYLTKPFSLDELLARVRAVLRRAQFSAKENAQGLQSTMTTGELTIDFSQHLVALGGREVALTPTEFSILAYLAQNAGRIVTQDLLLEHVWGSEYLGESHMLQVNVNRLRRKLEEDPTRPRYILTKVGVGYSLASLPPSETAAGSDATDVITEMFRSAKPPSSRRAARVPR